MDTLPWVDAARVAGDQLLHELRLLRQCTVESTAILDRAIGACEALSTVQRHCAEGASSSGTESAGARATVSPCISQLDQPVTAAAADDEPDDEDTESELSRDELVPELEEQEAAVDSATSMLSTEVATEIEEKPHKQGWEALAPTNQSVDVVSTPSPPPVDEPAVVGPNEDTLSESPPAAVLQRDPTAASRPEPRRTCTDGRPVRQKRRSVNPQAPEGREALVRKKRKVSPSVEPAPSANTRPPGTSSSTATKQPPWTAAEEEAFLDIVESGRTLGWMTTRIYATYDRYCRAQDPPWCVRGVGGCRAKLQRLHGGGEPTTKWSLAEMQLVNRLRVEGKPLRSIHNEHQSVFAAQGRSRTMRAVKQKLEVLPPWDPTTEMPLTASTAARLIRSENDQNHDARAITGRTGQGETRAAKVSWTQEEDACLKPYVATAMVDVDEIHAKLAELDTTATVTRSHQAILSRLKRLRTL